MWYDEENSGLFFFEVEVFVFSAIAAGLAIAVNISMNEWFLFLVGSASIGIGWIAFDRIWEKHRESGNGLRETQKALRWLILVAMIGTFLFWLRFR